MSAPAMSGSVTSGPVASDHRRSCLLPSSAIREALHGFTLRGRASSPAGLTAILCGIVLGERDLVRIGVLVSLLPLITVASRGPVGQPARPGAHPGAPARSRSASGRRRHLDLTNVGPTTGAAAGRGADPVGARVSGRGSSSTRCGPAGTDRSSTPSRPRCVASYDIGPLRVRVGDPFGLLSSCTARSPGPPAWSRDPDHRAAAGDPAPRRVDRHRRQPAAPVRQRQRCRRDRAGVPASATTCDGCTGAARRRPAS